VTPREVAALAPWCRILEGDGADPGRSGRTCCPVHGGDNPSSFSYNETIGKAYCFACGWSGDKIAFLQAALGLDFKAALARLAELAGVELNSYRKTNIAEPARRRAEAEAQAVLKHRQEEWEKELLAAHREAHEQAVEAADILELFWKHPELAKEMSELLNFVERQYSQAVDQLAVLGAKLDGELL